MEKGGQAWARLQERTDALIDPLGRVAMERLAVRAGEHVLDVGCGCGQTLVQLAARTGPSGHVLGVDISPPMLARAAENVAERPGVTLALADAQSYAFAPASFDALYSRFGVMFFEDPVAAFRNLHGAMRRDGRLSFVCWQALTKNPWASVPLEAVTRLLPPSSMPEMLRADRPGPYAFSDPHRVKMVLESGGWKDVAWEAVTMPLHVGGAATLEEAVTYCTQIGPAARAMAEAPEAQKPALVVALRESLAPFVTPQGVFMEGNAFVVTARV